MKINPKNLRNHVLDMVFDKKSGHIGGSFSLCEIIAYLHSNYDLITENKDKLILSKGHGVPAIYAVLYDLKLIDDLSSFREINSALQGHPDKNRLKFIHATTGSLGQGLSIAIGHALAYKIKKEDYKVFCILGDGEMQEGQVWEALMLAPKYKLNNLVCFVDYNKFQSDGELFLLENLAEKVRAFGWNVYDIDGHSEGEIEKSLKILDTDNEIPTFVILNTSKGKGVSFMENDAEWHSKIPSKEEYEKAKKELS
jgi:transketolase